MKSQKRRTAILVIAIIALIVFLVPLPSYAKDGGSVDYHAIVYNVTIRHSLAEKGYIKGAEIYIFGVKVFDNTKLVTESR
jgi:hypothetical protein